MSSPRAIEPATHSPFPDGSCQMQPPCHAQTIDEFLEMYRPTQSSILEFTEYIDHQTFICNKVGCKPSMTQEQASNSDDPILQYELDCIRSPKINDDPHSLGLMDAHRRPARRQSMSMNEKEDRRRDQNREAQRRYRERNMISTLRAICRRPMQHQNEPPISSSEPGPTIHRS
jgi:hypothetical protein